MEVDGADCCAQRAARRAVIDAEVRSIGRTIKSAVRRTPIRKVSSFRTQAALEEEPVQTAARHCEVADRLLTVFRRYDDEIVQQYFASTDFAQDFLSLCQFTKKVLRGEPAFFKLQGPVYVFGDVHGNVDDLLFFRDKLWPAGMELTAGKFLFLGDYVDRGMQGLEVLTMLFAQKVCSPHKVFMLRGNHELRYVNGWEAHYRDRSFLWQCKDRFGETLGKRVWQAANSVFDFLPLACTIDDTVFCSHGGIPRLHNDREGRAPDGPDTRLDDIASVALPARIVPHRLPEDRHLPEEEADPYLDPNEAQLAEWQTSVAMDLLWGDPCPSDPTAAASGDPSAPWERPGLDERGFGPGQRGGAAIMFGQQAIEEFFAAHNLSVMLRAHQASAAGVSVSKGGKVITVFSTSKDHALGPGASCAYLLVEDLRITVVNRVPDAVPAQTPAAAPAAARRAEGSRGGVLKRLTAAGSRQANKTVSTVFPIHRQGQGNKAMPQAA